MQSAIVHIIDDDAAVRDSIAALVDVRGFPSKTYATAEEFLAQLVPSTSGCVVTDIRIVGGMTGIELQKVLKSRGFDLPVIVISAFANVTSAVEAMHQGAITLLEKSCSTDELWAAIHAALQRDAAKQADRLKINEAWEKLRTLSSDEVSVMVRIINGVLNKVIAKDLGISLRTVESRRASVLKKVGVSSVPELVRLYVELETSCGRPPEQMLTPQPGTDDETTAS